MLETFFMVWVIGSVCMTLDFIRLYHKAIRTSQGMKEIVRNAITDALSQDSDLATKEQLSKFTDALEKDFSSQVSYRRIFLVGSITMYMFWPVALFSLVFNEQAYEKTMLESFSKPFRVVFAQLYVEIQEHLASQLTKDLFNDLMQDNLDDLVDRKDK